MKTNEEIKIKTYTKAEIEKAIDKAIVANKATWELAEAMNPGSSSIPTPLRFIVDMVAEARVEAMRKLVLSLLED